jgi:hypothetical protein
MLVSRGWRDTRGNGPLPPAISVLCKTICTRKGLHFFSGRKINQFNMQTNLISAVTTYISFRLPLKLSKFRFKTQLKQQKQISISVGSKNQPVSIGTVGID